MDEAQGKGFVFDDIEALSITDIRTLLGHCDQHLLVIALKGSSPMVRAKMFSALEPDSALALRRRLDTSGPAPLAEVEKAQEGMAAQARELLAQGRIKHA